MRIIVVPIVIMIGGILFSGCGDSSQTGSYISEGDPAEYFRRIEEMHNHNYYQTLTGGTDYRTMPRL